MLPTTPYRSVCAGRESNPGLVRGRDVYYHCTTSALGSALARLELTQGMAVPAQIQFWRKAWQFLLKSNFGARHGWTCSNPILAQGMAGHVQIQRGWAGPYSAHKDSIHEAEGGNKKLLNFDELI